MATLRQKKALEKLAENGGRSVSRAMVEAGYSPMTAKRPDKLTKSKGFQELAREYLPDNLLLEKHVEGLEATKIIISHTEPDKEVPDFLIRHKYLETGYKIRQKLVDSDVKDEKIIVNLIQFNAPDNTAPQHRFQAKTVSVASDGSSGKVQVVDFAPESGENSPRA